MNKLLRARAPGCVHGLCALPKPKPRDSLSPPPGRASLAGHAPREVRPLAPGLDLAAGAGSGFAKPAKP